MMKEDLEQAWNWRARGGLFEKTEALRVFHGPGEGTGELQSWAIDRFANHYWVTQWDSGGGREDIDRKVIEAIVEFLKSQGAQSVVKLGRPKGAVPLGVEALMGSVPSEPIVVKEGSARFRIRLLGTRHPGLFLDHAPLRQWLTQHSSGRRVLNTFAYTGSLSIAAAIGGASAVTTLDLSKSTIQWAQENWMLNDLSADRGRFISGDVFEWLPRLKREKQAYDCVILDPPSFSRGKKATFSTSKDLKKLHELAMGLLSPGGVLVTSINSANVSLEKYEAEVWSAARALGLELQILGQIELPDTFPVRAGDEESSYLKGWMLRVGN